LKVDGSYFSALPLLGNTVAGSRAILVYLDFSAEKKPKRKKENEQISVMNRM